MIDYDVKPVYLTQNELEKYLESLGADKIPDFFENEILFEINGYSIFIAEKTEDNKYLLALDLDDFPDEMKEILSIDTEDDEGNEFLCGVHLCPSIRGLYVEIQIIGDWDDVDSFFVPLLK
jgi:hypothetical protein